jgi:hypothetical protein
MEAEAKEVADHLRGLADHEAAHAMVAWAFKLRVFNYSIKPIMSPTGLVRPNPSTTNI